MELLAQGHIVITDTAVGLPVNVRMCLPVGTWYMLMACCKQSAQNTCWELIVGQRRTMSLPTVTVVTSAGRGSGSQTVRGKMSGNAYESHHSMHCCTSGSTYRGYDSAQNRTIHCSLITYISCCFNNNTLLCMPYGILGHIPYSPVRHCH